MSDRPGLKALLGTIASMALPTDAQRVFHGRGGLHPGGEHLALDYFPPVWVLTSFQAMPEDELESVHAALSERWSKLAAGAALNWVLQCRVEGKTETRLMAGSVTTPHVVTEDGARYLVHVLKGQKPWPVSGHGPRPPLGARIHWRPLGLQGAQSVCVYLCLLCGRAPGGGCTCEQHRHEPWVLAIGQQNHQLNELASGAGFWAHDIFTTWGKITRGGPYDLIIVDPPSYQKGSFVATKDYARLMRRLPDLLQPGGHALLCLNAPELGMAFLQEQMLELAPGLAFVQRVPNPPAFADVSQERSLKVLVYRSPE